MYAAKLSHRLRLGFANRTYYTASQPKKQNKIPAAGFTLARLSDILYYRVLWPAHPFWGRQGGRGRGAGPAGLFCAKAPRPAAYKNRQITAPARGIKKGFCRAMITIDELKTRLAGYRTAIDDLGEALAIRASEKRVAELENKMTMPGFYDDTEGSAKVFAEMSGLKGKLERYQKLGGLYDDAETMLLLCEEENDPALIPEGEAAVDAVAAAVDELQLITLLSGQYDKNNAILTFHAGTGGTEAQDWADMLFRMYNRWGAAHGYKVSTLDYLDGDEAGLKSASILVEGPNAYGMLKSENGVHRLVRISPFDAQSRRQTSFASLEVMPELDDAIQVDIRPEDIEMQVYRSSGAGGQHINKTSSAVRLIHKPTGIVVSCQTERSQFQNRDTAMKMLASKLYQIKEQEHLDKISDIKGVQKEIAWGHQIRSYVFMPYTLVKDHRTGFENGNVQAVMDGDLDGFINAYLTASATGELKK